MGGVTSDSPSEPIRSAVVLSVVVSALLIGVFAWPISRWWFVPGLNWPNLPNVGQVPWNPTGHFRSSTAQLFSGIYLALLGAGLAEIAKAIGYRRGSRMSYLLASAFQLAILVETFLGAASDWAAHAASLLLSHGEAFVRTPANGRFPWISLVAAIGLVGLEVSNLSGNRRRGS